MIVRTIQEGSTLTFEFTPETGDELTVGRASLAASTTRVELDHSDEIHPDLLALAATLCVSPWTKSIKMSVPVSEGFAEAVLSGMMIAVGPVDSKISSRVRPVDGYPSLSYSGGADCTAALTVMPASTRSYFLNRISRPSEGWKGLYNKDAALHSCDSLAKEGMFIRKIETDLEFLRNPVGFPHDLANCIPAILHADFDCLDSIGWGAVLESTYRVGALKYRDYSFSPFVAGFGAAFAAVGLPVYNAVAGVSEVGTSLISLNSKFGKYAQSCMRGTVGEPCRNCWKCTRKILLDSSLTGKWPTYNEIIRMFKKVATPTYLDRNPLKHEGVIAFMAERYPVDLDQGIMRMLQDKVGGYPTGWMLHTYTPALQFIPEDYRELTAASLREYMPEMNDEEVQTVESWDIRELVKSDSRIRDHEVFMNSVRDFDLG